MTQNTNNTKITILSLLGVAFFGGYVAWIFQKAQGVLSFEVAFFCFLSVFGVLKLSLKKHLTPQENTKETFSKKVVLGLGISFSIFRILAYIVLVLALLALLHYGFFSLYAYIAGVFVGMLWSAWRARNF